MQNKSQEERQGNILLVANYHSDAGYAWWLMENFWIAISEYFLPLGRRCYLIYPQISSLSEGIANSSITVLKCDFNDQSRVGRRKLKNILQQNSITSIYLTDQPYCSTYYATLRTSGVSRIVTHDHTPGDRPAITGLRGIAKSIRNRINPICSNSVLCVSEFIRERNISNGRVPKIKCITVQNGIQPIQCDNANSAYVYREFGIPEDSITVVSTGRANKYKRIDFIIRCADRIVNSMKISNIFFLHCGDGPQFSQLKLLVAELGLCKNFILAGNRNDVCDILCSCHIAVHASAGEAFSLSIIEYMSAGLATMVPDIPSVCQAVTHDFDGLIYRDNDVKHASELIIRLSKDHDYRKTLGSEASNTVTEHYDIRESNECFRKVIADVL